jgi:hypothetical protein
LTLPFSPSHLFSFLLSSPSQYKFLAYIMLGIFGVVGGTFLITGGAVWYLFGREGAKYAGDYLPNRKALETAVEASKAIASASAKVEL